MLNEKKKKSQSRKERSKAMKSKTSLLSLSLLCSVLFVTSGWAAYSACLTGRGYTVQ
jgi:hypothetical protein